MALWEELGDDDESLSTTIRNVGLVIGGVVATLLAVWRSKVAERQANTAQQSLLNERYQRGAAMLGSDVLTVRLGGIYALQRLADEQPKQYHIQIMQLLCGFARHPTTVSGEDLMEADGELPRRREDVQAVMTAISACHKRQLKIERETKFQLDFDKAVLSGLSLSGGNLAGAKFDGADLSWTLLRNTDLSNATLMSADLSDAHLTGANLSGALFWNTDLSGLNLLGANLSRTWLLHANLSNLSNASLNDVDLSHAQLDGANLSDARFQGANLSGASLTNADLSGADFSAESYLYVDVSDLPGGRSEDKGEMLAKGLTQAQLDEARADPENPPKLDGVLDAETGEQLVWRGRPLDN